MLQSVLRKIDLYWYDEWMVQDINNETLTEVNLVC